MRTSCDSRRAAPAGELAGQVALVTGAGRGIGRELALALSAAGAAVGLVARSTLELHETMQMITVGGGTAAAASADLANPAHAKAALAEIDSRLGPVDLLVNNAGIAGPVGDTWDIDPLDWWRTIEVNLGGAFYCTEQVLPSMLARGAGRVVNITSQAGVLRWPQVSAYAVSKAALIKLTENVAAETRQHAIGIFSVDPGLVPIGLTAVALAGRASRGTPQAARDAWLRQELAAGRGAHPDAVCRLVVRLASGHADGLSGCHLSVHDDLDTIIARADGACDGDLFRLRRRVSHMDDRS